MIERALPKNYRSVYAELQAAGHGRHLNAYEVFLRLREREAGISQTTVYRALERLVAAKLVDAVVAPSAKHITYEIAAPMHAHFYCRMCGTMQDIAVGVSEAELCSQADLAGAQVERTSMTLEGRCRNCV